MAHARDCKSCKYRNGHGDNAFCDYFSKTGELRTIKYPGDSHNECSAFVRGKIDYHPKRSWQKFRLDGSPKFNSVKYQTDDYFYQKGVKKNAQC